MNAVAPAAPGGTLIAEDRICGADIDVHGFHVGCNRDMAHPGWHHGRVEETGEGLEIVFEVTWR